MVAWWSGVKENKVRASVGDMLGGCLSFVVFGCVLVDGEGPRGESGKNNGRRGGRDMCACVRWFTHRVAYLSFVSFSVSLIYC